MTATKAMIDNSLTENKRNLRGRSYLALVLVCSVIIIFRFSDGTSNFFFSGQRNFYRKAPPDHC